ncbi:hypothetical protein L0666_01645 [Octadecabacter sp. CECT 8868]|nr:hypothetical protein [Octadecabacter algicola]
MPLVKALRLSAVVSPPFLPALAVVCALVMPLSKLLTARLMQNGAIFFAGIVAIPALVMVARIADHMHFPPKIQQRIFTAIPFSDMMKIIQLHPLPPRAKRSLASTEP